jgi:hypothetical protein
VFVIDDDLHFDIWELELTRQYGASYLAELVLRIVHAPIDIGRFGLRIYRRGIFQGAWVVEDGKATGSLGDPF